MGGNMRLRALQAITTMTDDDIMRHIEQSAKFNGRPEVEREALLRYWQKFRDDPMVSVARTDNMTEDERREFIIKDNVGFGAWDWDMLANDWDTDELDARGLPMWDATPKDFGANDGSSFDGKLPHELNGVDLMADDLPTINGDDHTFKQRIIITYTDEQKDFLAALLGLASINKVQYDVTEFQEHTADEIGTTE